MRPRSRQLWAIPATSGSDVVAHAIRRLLRRAVGARPTLSVIVPVYNVEPYLQDTLDSLRAQTLTDLQILLVDDGSTDASLAIARAGAAVDPRVVVLEQDHAGLGAARNHGLAHVTGRYVTFLDSDDTVPPDAYEAMVASLESSGSDFALGTVRRFDGTRTWVPGWMQEAHARAHTGATLATCPGAIKDILAANRVYRTSFWHDRVQRFPEGVVYEDHVPMLSAYLRGARFDVLTQITYHWRARPEGTSLAQQKEDLSNLVDRVGAKAAAWDLLQAEAEPLATRLWLGRVLDLDLSPYYQHAPNASTEYRAILSAAVRRYLDLALDPAHAGALDLVASSRRLTAWLVAHEDWTALAEVQRRSADGAPVLPTVHDGVARLDACPVPSSAPPLPEDLRGATSFETRVSTRLLRVRWAADGAAHLELVARLHGLAVDPRTVRAEIAGTDHDSLTVPARLDPALLVGGPKPPRGTPVGMRATIPADLIASLAAGPDAEVELELRLDIDGLRRAAPLSPARGSGAAQRHGALLHASPAVVVAQEPSPAGLALRFTTAPAVLTSARRDADGVVLVIASTTSDPVTQVRAGTQGGVLAEHDGASWRLPLPASESGPFVEAMVGGRWCRVRTDAPLPPGLLAAPRCSVRLADGPRFLLTRAQVDADTLLLDVVERRPGPTVQWTLGPDSVDAAEQVQPGADDADPSGRSWRLHAPLALLSTPHGGDSAARERAATRVVHGTTSDGAEIHLAIAANLAEHLPVVLPHRSGVHEVTLARAGATVITRPATPGA